MPSPSRARPAEPLDLIAIFGPTAAGKTAVAIELAGLLRERGEDPVAISADSIQVYRGLEALSGAATAAERERLEHRLVGVADVAEEWSAGRFAELAQAEIDTALAAGRRPLVVGGTGLYMRAALAELELRPPADPELRAEVEAELAERGAAALHAELPERHRETTHPNDGKRIVRLTELLRSGIEPHAASEGLWTGRLRRPTALFGLTLARAELDAAIERRARAIAAAGAAEEVRAAEAAGASRTARAAIGFAELARGDVEALIAAQRRFARSQLTWLRKMPGLRLVERAGRGDGELAAEILARLDRGE